MPNPPKKNASSAVSAKNILLIKPLRAPIARIMPISAARSMAAMLRVFIMIIMATKKISSTNTCSAPCVMVANCAISPADCCHVRILTFAPAASIAACSRCCPSSTETPGLNFTETKLNAPSSRFTVVFWRVVSCCMASKLYAAAVASLSTTTSPPENRSSSLSAVSASVCACVSATALSAAVT